MASVTHTVPTDAKIATNPSVHLSFLAHLKASLVSAIQPSSHLSSKAAIPSNEWGLLSQEFLDALTPFLETHIHKALSEVEEEVKKHLPATHPNTPNSLASSQEVKVSSPVHSG
jgi:hypothetical protein